MDITMYYAGGCLALAMLVYGLWLAAGVRQRRQAAEQDEQAVVGTMLWNEAMDEQDHKGRV